MGRGKEETHTVQTEYHQQSRLTSSSSISVPFPGWPPTPPSRLEAINWSPKTLRLLWFSEPYTLLSICAIASPLTVYFPSCSVNIWIKKLKKGFLGGSAVKNTPANTGDAGLIPELERFPGGEMATHSNNTLGLRNSTDRRACQATVHGLTKRRTRLSN